MTTTTPAKVREIKSTIDVTTNSLRIDVVGHESLIIDCTTLLSDIATHAMLHGLKQKICDSAALGAGYTLAEKYTAMLETMTRITDETAPSWNKRAEGGGSVTGLLYRALLRLYPDKPAEKLRSYHDGLDKKQQAALRGNPKIATIIEEIKAEAVDTKGIDSDELLSGLMISSK